MTHQEESDAADRRVEITTAATDHVVRKVDRTNRVIRVMWATLVVYIGLVSTGFAGWSIWHQDHVSKIRTAQGAEIINLVSQVKALQVAGHQTGLANQQILKIVQSVTDPSAVAANAAQSAATLKLAVSCIAAVINVDTGHTTAKIPAECAVVLGSS